MEGVELGHLTGQDQPDSQTAGAKRSTTVLSVYVFSLQASALAVYRRYTGERFHSIQLYPMFLTF